MKYSQAFWDEEDRLTRLEDDPTVPYRAFEKEKSKMPSVTVSEYVRLREIANKTGLTTREAHTLISQMTADGFDLADAPLAPASDNPKMEPELPRAVPVYANYDVARPVLMAILTSLKPGTKFTADEVMKRIGWTDEMLTPMGSMQGARRHIGNLIRRNFPEWEAWERNCVAWWRVPAHLKGGAE